MISAIYSLGALITFVLSGLYAIYFVYKSVKSSNDLEEAVLIVMLFGMLSCLLVPIVTIAWPLLATFGIVSYALSRNEEKIDNFLSKFGIEIRGIE